MPGPFQYNTYTCKGKTCKTLVSFECNLVQIVLEVGGSFFHSKNIMVELV